MDRTVRLLVCPTVAQQAMLLDTLEQFTAAFNTVATYGWQHGEKNGVALHHATYYGLRLKWPTLNANLLIQARVKATETVKSALTRQRNGRKVSCPHSQACPVRYNDRTMALNWERGTVALSTTTGRQTLVCTVPAWSQKYAGYRACMADLLYRNGRFWLHVVVNVPTPEVAPSGHVTGVDLGIVRPAVTSDNKFFGERRWRELEARYFRLRRALQAKGTKSARRHLRQLKGKQLRLRRDLDHQLSRRIVDSVAPGSTIVVENLKDIRTRVKQRKGRQNRRFHGWSFAQLRTFLTYKAEDRGSTVVGVDPRHTSQTCPSCGFVYRHNRRSQSEFCCRRCGFQLKADLVGARNIRTKYLADVGKTDIGGLPVNQAIVGAAEILSHVVTHKLPTLAGSR